MCESGGSQNLISVIDHVAILWIGVGLSSVVLMECPRMSALYVYISSVTVYRSNCNGNGTG